MAHAPPHRRRLRSIDSDLRAIGLLAIAIVCVAILSGFEWSCMTDGDGGARRGAEAVGATLTAVGRDRLVVDSIRGDGAAMRAGLRVGDLVEAVNGAAVPTVSAADRALRGPRVDIRIRRGMRMLDVHLQATGGMAFGQQGSADRG